MVKNSIFMQDKVLKKYVDILKLIPFLVFPFGFVWPFVVND